ncbi:uncharacterized protein N7459_006264 [Penicillium hispanicum]|uniref:uncharacterized protein n=1 Tax=Penicillium hispanicum TaxID=1080232 RepID=UPI002541AA4C|nr:uncharacterized protein N7459_006264 [Penicillium hispanicum]KAJ5580279.1 hypothetical protein N7459_006264 [Penicillium hispanicum]
MRNTLSIDVHVESKNGSAATRSSPPGQTQQGAATKTNPAFSFFLFTSHLAAFGLDCLPFTTRVCRWLFSAALQTYVRHRRPREIQHSQSLPSAESPNSPQSTERRIPGLPKLALPRFDLESPSSPSENPGTARANGGTATSRPSPSRPLPTQRGFDLPHRGLTSPRRSSRMPDALMCSESTRDLPDLGIGDAGYRDAPKCSRRGYLSGSQGRRWRDTSKRRWHQQQPRPSRWSSVWWVALFCLVLSWASPAAAVLLDFDNCLDKAVLDSDPVQLQYVPLDVAVHFNLSDSLHPLNVTVYGNVSGTADGSSNYPSMYDPSWNNTNSTTGKIVDVSTANNMYTTLIPTFNVLSFVPWSNSSQFCESVIQGECPLGPVFNYNLSDLSTLRAFSVQHDMISTYRFSTITPTLLIRSGDASAAEIGCISVPITPDFGTPLKNALTYIPLVILILVGIATLTAAMYTPWGTTDVFRWTSNYGRDEDILRLVTPGFADCLQYLQFAVLTGSLSLNYPGFFQPAVSHGAWSVLMFNQSFVNPDGGYEPIVDGVYKVNGTYGLGQMNQLVGMASSQDIWPGMMIWLLVILVCITVLVQGGFALRWLHRELAHSTEQDLRSKNMPFTVGNVIRIVFNYLLLPIISLSFFQLVIAGGSPAYSVALAAVVIIILICFAIWFVRVIVTTRPKSHLFDDLPTVLLYGPLYNTYCDDAAAFAMVPIFLNFARGVAIGALQPSGIAQVVLLAICEVVSVLTLVAFRPFPGPTHMNLYHCLFSFVRFLTIIMMVVFVPSLTVSNAARGWIGYVILVLHALVLIFGFFLNALQTLIEVSARLAGAGGATRGGLTKVFGMRQLSRRMPRRDIARQSLGSEAAMLAHGDERMSSQYEGSRPRSLSGSSALLLNRATISEGRASGILDYASSQAGSHGRTPSAGLYTSSPTAYTGAGYSSVSPSSSTFIGAHPRDPYYRPPRPGRRTQSGSTDMGKRNSRNFMKPSRTIDFEDEVGDATPMSGRGTPVPAYIPAPKDDMEMDDTRQRKDYAVREVDFYYRVRGPPLSHTGTRKLKTGPADPTGPVSSATGFFRNLFQGKTKDKGKGFEVVRSSRAPPPGLFPEGDYNEPYRDDPEDAAAGAHSRNVSDGDMPYRDSEGDRVARRSSDANVPVLPQVDSVGSIELPSRVGSRRTQAASEHAAGDTSHALDAVTETGSPQSRHAVDSDTLQPESPATARLPFSGNSSPSRERGLSVASTSASLTSSHRTGPDGVRTDRPSSMGYVAQHRTQDNIHQASPDEPSFTGSAAELVDENLHEDH